MELPTLPDRPARLQWAAQAKGIATAAALAAHMQEVESTVRSHWNGTRVFSRPKAIAYAKALGVPFLWLWEGAIDTEESSGVPPVAQKMVSGYMLLNEHDRDLVNQLISSLGQKKTG